ncbi:MAG: YopX family protein [Alistipes sp.]
MRKIKFRGYSKERQRWVYGYYYGGLRWADFIIEDAGFENRVQVDPATVGQFTGLLDKNGKEIYEGDIIFENEIKTYWRIRYDVPLSEWRTENIHDDCDDCELNAAHLDRSEIIGNPELLK